MEGGCCRLFCPVAIIVGCTVRRCHPLDSMLHSSSRTFLSRNCFEAVGQLALFFCHYKWQLASKHSVLDRVQSKFTAKEGWGENQCSIMYVSKGTKGDCSLSVVVTVEV